MRNTRTMFLIFKDRKGFHKTLKIEAVSPPMRYFFIEPPPVTASIHTTHKQVFMPLTFYFSHGEGKNVFIYEQE